MRSVNVPIRSVTVHLARSFQHSVVYCLLPPTLVYLAVLQPGLFSVYCLIHCTTTKTTFSELPRAHCWTAIVFSVTRAVVSLLPNILWCHSLLALNILFPEAVTMTTLAFLIWTITADMERRMQALEIRCFRKLLGILYRHRITNVEVKKKARIGNAIGPYEDLTSTFNEKTQTEVVRARHTIIWTGQDYPTGNSTRRETKRQTEERWEDNIKEWTGLEWNIMLRKAKNREEWRKLVVKSTVVPQRSTRNGIGGWRHCLICSSGGKALKHSREYFVSCCLKQDKVPGNGVFHVLDLEKTKNFSFRGLAPWPPPGAFYDPRTPNFRLFDFTPFPSLLHVVPVLAVDLIRFVAQPWILHLVQL